MVTFADRVRIVTPIGPNSLDRLDQMPYLVHMQNTWAPWANQEGDCLFKSGSFRIERSHSESTFRLIDATIPTQLRLVGRFASLKAAQSAAQS